jgi:alkylhydroperoxidase family enzyme
VQAVLDNWRTAPIHEQLRVTLGFLEQVTLAPSTVSPDDVAPLHAAGVSEQAIEDALYVCAYFNIIDRMADALDFDVPSAEAFSTRADMLLERGYLPSLKPS